jgi:nucleotide-binding universal stress UspA family protein
MVGDKAGIFNSMGIAGFPRRRAPQSKQQPHRVVKSHACAERRSGAASGHQGGAMPAYLVVIDESEEARAALRFAARRAARTGSKVEIVALIPPPDFVQWGAVQAAMEEEARLRAEAKVLQASGAIIEEAGVRPSITVKQGDPIREVTNILKDREDIAALVLGAAAEGGPGPLVAHFAGAVAGTLPCPVIIVPGNLSDETLDRLS